VATLNNDVAFSPVDPVRSVGYEGVVVLETALLGEYSLDLYSFPVRVEEPLAGCKKANLKESVVDSEISVPPVTWRPEELIVDISEIYPEQEEPRVLVEPVTEQFNPLYGCGGSGTPVASRSEAAEVDAFAMVTPCLLSPIEQILL